MKRRPKKAARKKATPTKASVTSGASKIPVGMHDTPIIIEEGHSITIDIVADRDNGEMSTLPINHGSFDHTFMYEAKKVMSDKKGRKVTELNIPSNATKLEFFYNSKSFSLDVASGKITLNTTERLRLGAGGFKINGGAKISKLKVTSSAGTKELDLRSLEDLTFTLQRVK